MIIIRDGKEIELTSRELYEAYNAYDLDCKKQDIADEYTRQEKPVPNDEKLTEIANRFAHNLSKNDGYYEAYWASLEVTIDEYEGEF